MEVDPFRDTWIRYLGYANEVGEAFRPLVPGTVVRWSYSVAFAYVLADTFDKSWKMSKKDGRTSQVAIETGDALIWQTLASVVIPGYTINRISYYTSRVLCTYAGTKIPPKVRRWITVGVGLACIPFIVKPIDTGVTIFMDQTYRRFMKSSTK